MSNNQLKTFVRFDGLGRIVPSSMVIAYSMPKVGKWKEINSYLTTTSTTTTSTSSTTTTTTTTTIFIPTVTIGTQLWTTSNLGVTTYRNGDPIPEVTDPTEWAGLTTGAWCYYNNDSANGAIYGKLYNWYAVNDARGLAPSGFHIPSNAEWSTLISFLGGTSVAGGKMKSTGTSLWLSPNGGATNESGFSGFPSGRRIPNGSSVFIRSYGYWWSRSDNLSLIHI